MKRTLAILSGKIINAIGKPLGKGTNLPGEVALKIDAALLSEFTYDATVIAVSGSNGKTSTTNLLTHILRSMGFKVVSNEKGSNLLGGVATAFLTGSDMKGHVDADYIVLEVDERFSPLIFRHFSPDYLLVTNLFRDQLTRNGNVDMIIEKLQEAIRPDVKLILNGNDPISSTILPDNSRVYFTMNRTERSTDAPRNITVDTKVCPSCHGHLEYDYYHYNHIGSFHCPNCGLQIKDSRYTADNVDFRDGSMTVNGCRVTSALPDVFNLLNTTAAIAVCGELGLDLSQVCQYASTFKPLKQRYNEYSVDGRRAVLLLSKNQNPVSYDQSIEHVCQQPGQKTAVVFVNNINHTFNLDTTWLYDISFELLKDHVENIICIGPRNSDLVARLLLGGFDEKQVISVDTLSELPAAIKKTQGDIYLLTELYDAHKILEVLKHD